MLSQAAEVLFFQNGTMPFRNPGSLDFLTPSNFSRVCSLALDDKLVCADCMHSYSSKPGLFIMDDEFNDDFFHAYLKTLP